MNIPKPPVVIGDGDRGWPLIFLPVFHQSDVCSEVFGHFRKGCFCESPPTSVEIQPHKCLKSVSRKMGDFKMQGFINSVDLVKPASFRV